ncbi:MAG: hypothetical protein A3I79_03100 [Gemmatimonadetes bacterium RIFCSPLOWO2_02_FULL_71_11]|nr:MAG: hypothetical protein A3I79_03100 [Gemmatimonadetes bacterium RIFCSPLOWO2_02_FULL_71_11]
MMSELTSTFFFGSILPLAVTIEVRSRFCTFSRRTSVDGCRRLEALSVTNPPMMITPRAIRMIFRFFVISLGPVPYRSGRPTAFSRAAIDLW